MEFEKLVKKDLIAFTNEKTKVPTLQKIIDLLSTSGKIPDVPKFRELIAHREQLMSTGIGLGIALPHGRLAGIDEPVIAVAVDPVGITDYESIDGKPVKAVFMIAVGEGKHKQYLEILAQIVCKLKNDEMRESLFSCQSVNEIYTLLTGEANV